MALLHQDSHSNGLGILNNNKAYQVFGLLYLMVSDFWLARVVFQGNILAVFVLLVFGGLLVLSRESFVLFKIDRPIVFALVGFGFLIFINAVFGRGISGTAVFSRYIFLLTYFLAGHVVCRGFGINIMIMALAAPFLLRACVALPTLVASSGNLFSISEVMLKAEGGSLLSSSTFRWGVGSYTLYSAMAILAPFCMVVIPVLKGKLRFIWVLGVVVLILNVLLSGYLNPLVQLSLGVTLLLVRKFRVKTLVFGSVVVFVLGLFLQAVPIIKVVLDKAAMVFSMVKDAGLIADPTGRGYLATISLETFRENWMFGVGPYEFKVMYMEKIGGHSTFFDWPAQYGILSFVFIWLVFREIWKAGRTFQLSGREWLAGSTHAFLVVVIAACFLNPLFLKGSLDLVVFSLLGAFHHENRVWLNDQ